MRFLKFRFQLVQTTSILMICLLITSCTADKEYVVYRLPANANYFLAGTAGKTWKLARRINNGTRVNMGECTLGYRQTYLTNHTVTDNNSDMYDCGESMNGTWRLAENAKGAAFVSITSDLVPKYFDVPDGTKTKNFQLIELSEGVLAYKFKHRLFSDKTTIVVDILVPEDSTVDDRNFHW